MVQSSTYLPHSKWKWSSADNYTFQAFDNVIHSSSAPSRVTFIHTPQPYACRREMESFGLQWSDVIVIRRKVADLKLKLYKEIVMPVILVNRTLYYKKEIYAPIVNLILPIHS